jgi:hypothetical protein
MASRRAVQEEGIYASCGLADNQGLLRSNLHGEEEVNKKLILSNPEEPI